MSTKLSAYSMSVAIFLSSLAILSMIAYVSLVPRPKEQFFQIYVLGETKMAEKYYPNNNPSIATKIRVKWHLGATNFMGSLQYVVLKVKLANSTIPAPDDANKLPSPGTLVKEFQRVMMDNETWEFPFTWSIENVRLTRETLFITSMAVNDRTVSIASEARNGQNYRLIVEIWTLDQLDQKMIFGWRAGNDRKVAWLQIWFNATLPKI